MLTPIADLPVFESARWEPDSSDALRVDAEALTNWLVLFLRDECVRRRGAKSAVIGVSGGVDSAVTAFLCARAFGPENTHAFLMPYRISSPDSVEHARLGA
ncbi:MAG: NAD+ synthase, partial [Armatimonadota bacterium]